VAQGYTGQFLMEDELADGGALYGKNTEINEYNSAIDATLDLIQSGRIDAVVMDEYVALYIQSQHGGIVAKELRYRNGDLAAEDYGVLVAKGNEDLLEIINKVIKKLIEEDKIREWVIQFSQ